MRTNLILLALLAAPALAQEDPEAFVTRHAGEDRALSLQEVRAALAELELMVVVQRELRGVDYRLEELRHRLEEEFEGDPADAELREATLLGLVAHVELQLARGLVKDAWNEFPETPKNDADPEAAAWQAILLDPRVAQLREYVSAKKDGRPAAAPESSPLLGLRPEHDEVDKAVMHALEMGDAQFIRQLGERAAPALARAVAQELNVLPTKGLDALVELVQAHPPTAAALMRANLGEKGFFWKKRMVRACSDGVFTKGEAWDSSRKPWVCRIPDYLVVMESLVQDAEVSTEALGWLKSVAHGGGLSPDLISAVREALASDDATQRATAQKLLPSSISEATRPLVEAALDTPYVEVRRAAAGLLVNLEWSDALAAHASDPDADVRGLVALSLQSRQALRSTPHGGGQWFHVSASLDRQRRDLALKLLVDPEAGVRRQAAKALEGWPSEELRVQVPGGRNVVAMNRVLQAPDQGLLRAAAVDADSEVRMTLSNWALGLPPAQALDLLALFAADSEPKIANRALTKVPEPWVYSHPKEVLAIIRAYRAQAGSEYSLDQLGSHWRDLMATPEGCKLTMEWATEEGPEVVIAVLSPGYGDEVYFNLRTHLAPQTYVALLGLVDDGDHESLVYDLLRNTSGRLDPALQALAADGERTSFLRAMAAVALAQRAEAGWQDSLQTALRDPDWERRAEGGGYFKQLYEAFRSLPAARANAFALAAVRDPATQPYCLSQLISNTRLAERGAGGVELALAIRARWFSGPDSQARGHEAVRNVIRQMPRSPALRDDEFLAAALETDEYARDVVAALGKMRDPAHLPLLARVVHERRGEWVWIETVREVLPAYLTDESAELLLLAAAWAEEPSVRAHCLNSLESMRGYFLARDYWARRRALTDTKDQAVAELSALLDDDNEAVRVQAIRGLATFDAVSAIPRLIRLLKDPSPAIAVAAAEALEVLNRPHDEPEEAAGDDE